MTEESNETPSWNEGLPEGLADASFFKGADSLEGAITAVNNAAAHMGSSIRIPSEEAGAEDKSAFIAKIMEKAPSLMRKPDITDPTAMSEFYQSMGMPKESAEYKIELEEGKELPSDFSGFAAMAHKAGLTNDQFKGVMTDIMAEQDTQTGINEALQRDEIKALATEWGAAYEQNMAAIKNFLLLSDAPEGLVTLLAEGTMSTNEMKWIHQVATATKSTTELNTQPNNAVIVMTPSEARNQIQEMLNNQEHPYWKGADPRHNDAVSRMVELQKLANPDSSTSVDRLRA
jgi:hypothetical protein